MMKIPTCLLLTLLVAFRAYQASAALDNCVDGACPPAEANANTCSSDTTAVCVCDITYKSDDTDCNKIACVATDATAINTECGGPNTFCDDSSPDLCQCAINYEVVGLACNLIACTGDNEASKCTDTGNNDYCDITAGTCACKKNFVGTNAATCTRAPCSDSVTCDEPNSECTDPTSSGGTCVCDHLSTADTTSGECVRDSCTASNVATVCGTQAACEFNPNALQCVCNVNYAPSHTGTACVQKECVSGATTNCDPNSVCASTNGPCQCATTHTASGSRCKRDCSSDAGVCDSDNAACVGGVCECNANYVGDGATCTQSTCTTNVVTTCHPNSKCNAENKCECADTFTTSGTMCKKDCSTNSSLCHTNAACTSNVCQCNVNYDGDGSSCEQRTCTGTDASTCHSDSKCVSGKCVCKDNYQPDGQSCVACASGTGGDGTECKKTCTSQTDCGPTTAVCTSGFCACTTNYEGNGTTCAAAACTANTDCGTSNNYTCTSAGTCGCADGFSFSNTAIDCVASGGIVLYSLSLMIAALLMTIFNNKGCF